MAEIKDKMTIVIPTLNEEESIIDVVNELKRNGFNRIVIVDGHSVDGTVEIAKDLGVTVIMQNGRGKGAALRQAFNDDNVDGEIIAIMDADGSMSPKELPLYLEAMGSGADLVKGSRFLLGGYSEDMNLIRNIGNRFFIFWVNRLWSAHYTDLCYGFGAFRKDALKKLCSSLNSVNFEIETEIFIKAKKLGLKVVEIPSIEFKRRHGKSNLHIVTDGLRILKIIFKEFVNGHQ